MKKRLTIEERLEVFKGKQKPLKTIDLDKIETPRAMLEKMKKHPELEKQYKKQYSAARDIIQKRLKRIRAYKVKPGEFDPRQSQFYLGWEKRYGGSVPKLKDLKGDQLAYLLDDMKRSLKDPITSTIEGLQISTELRLQGLYKHGYGVVPGTEKDDTPEYFITKKNMADFGNFMERYRALHQHSIGSPEAVDMYMYVKSVGMTNTEFFKEFKEYFSSKEKGLKMIKAFREQYKKNGGNAQNSELARQLLKERLPK